MMDFALPPPPHETVNTATGGQTAQNTLTPSSASLATKNKGVAIYFHANQNRTNPSISGATKDFGFDTRSNEWFAGAHVFRTPESAAFSITSTVVASGVDYHIAMAASFG